MTDLVVRSRRVLTPDGLRAASLQIRAGRIRKVAGFEETSRAATLLDAGDAVVMPGLVDTHVHINEPGRTDWEGFEAATRAAAAGGVTSIVDMPLNSVPATTNVAALEAKIVAATGALFVDVGFWGGVVPGNGKQLRAMLDAGVFGFKCFLAPSGVEEFPCVGEDDLRKALPVLAASRVPLLVHAECLAPAAAVGSAGGLRPERYATWLAARPRQAENKAMALLISLAEEFRAAIHVVHLSSSEALGDLRNAQRRAIPISAETCPHYLYFAAEDIPDGATQFKCAPPIRERANGEKLWLALEQGWISMIVSDHSPCPVELKLRQSGDFLRAWGGISSLQLSLPAVWTQMRRRGYSLERLGQWMSSAPAELAGLTEHKGALLAGHDADLVIWRPEESFRVEATKLHHRHKLTPYAGERLYGVVETTILRGQVIYTRETFLEPPSGRLLLRGRL
jgi:allantoinase